MLPQRNVVNLVDHKSSQQQQQRRRRQQSGANAAGGSSSNASAAGRRIMIKITRNPFFNFRTLVRHGVGAAAVAAGRNAVALSTMAGREWSALDEQQKRPYRRLAHLSKMNGGPFFVRLEHLRTFLRYPECVQNNEYLARTRRPSSAKRPDGGPHQRRQQQQPPPSNRRHSGSRTGVRPPDGVSPQPDANFGGYEVAPKSGN